MAPGRMAIELKAESSQFAHDLSVSKPGQPTHGNSGTNHYLT
jgi:hypothetical protein